MNYNGTTGGVLNGNNGGSPGTAGERTYTFAAQRHGLGHLYARHRHAGPPRCHAMAFDTCQWAWVWRSAGSDISFVKMADSWKWDGTTWAEPTTAHAPSGATAIRCATTRARCDRALWRLQRSGRASRTPGRSISATRRRTGCRSRLIPRALKQPDDADRYASFVKPRAATSSRSHWPITPGAAATSVR